MRIVSLIPSATEILAGLGLADRLVGLSHECDHPPHLPDLPRLTEPKLDPGAPSADIDRQVKDLVEQALGVYRIDAERLQALAPDIIVTQDQCEVCAVSQGELQRALGGWLDGAPQLISLSPQRLDDIFDDVQRVAALTGVPERGIELVLAGKKRLDAMAEKAAGAEIRPRVAMIEWIEPLMTGGNWMPELVALAGGENLLSEPGVHSPFIDFADLAKADPDILVVSPCGFDLERTRAEMVALEKQERFRRLRAVAENRVYLTDGNAYFNRPGPRIVDSAEILGEILHPELFAPAHGGEGWAKLSTGA